MFGLAAVLATSSWSAESVPGTGCDFGKLGEPKSLRVKYELLKLKSECQANEIELLKQQLNEVTQQTMQLTLRFNEHVGSTTASITTE
jgi:hypothetical protein